MSASANTIAASIRWLLVAAGLYAVWCVQLSPAARARRTPPQLTEWAISGIEFLQFLVLAICGMVTGSLIGTVLLMLRPLSPEAKAMFLTAWSHAGAFAGIATFKLLFERVPLGQAALRARDFRNGAVTFMVVLPVVTVAQLFWLLLLQATGIPLEKQELAGMFANASSPLLIVFMTGLATISAPVAEELVFRAGLFRYARTRLPRWAALVAPACVFAALHQNLASFLPLAALGVVFSLAYERTGRIATTIVAHALFNLCSAMLILCGIGT